MRQTDIEAVFAALGLGTEEERASYSRLERLNRLVKSPTAKSKPRRFQMASTEDCEEKSDAELESDTP